MVQFVLSYTVGYIRPSKHTSGIMPRQCSRTDWTVKCDRAAPGHHVQACELTEHAACRADSATVSCAQLRAPTNSEAFVELLEIRLFKGPFGHQLESWSSCCNYIWEYLSPDNLSAW